METKLSPAKKISGRVQVPSDKSLTHRAVFFSALAEGESTILNPLTADDCLSTLKCVEQLGCEVERRKGAWVVRGRGLGGLREPSVPLDCGNSGTTMRLISGILSAQPFTTELIGDSSLSKRPMDRVAVPLESMGANFELTNKKYAPFKIKGTRKLKPIHWKNPVASAQVKSAVLFAGLHAHGETIYEEPSLSRDHTERMLGACGANIERRGSQIILKGPSPLTPQTWAIPGDFSSAAFFIVAALLLEGSKLTVTDVNTNPTRTGLLSVLQKMGGQFEIKETIKGGEPLADITVRGAQKLGPGEVTERISAHLIDEIPILAVVATQATGTTVIRGVDELRFKETDRLKALAQNLTAMGAHIKEEPGGLIIGGPTPLVGTTVHSFDDHRIAMSMAIAALIAKGETTIKGAECVTISFPTFWEMLSKLTRS